MEQKKTKALFILHATPPMHGAAIVGDIISNSEKIKASFDSKFIFINSSDLISDIGKVSLKKISSSIKLFLKVSFSLLMHQPEKIYFTPSPSGIAFYRDFLISFLWKFFSVFRNIEIFYHYHAGGIEKFTSSSKIKNIATNFFMKRANIILLDPLLKNELKDIKTYKKIFFLQNGISDQISEEEFKDICQLKYTDPKRINILFLSHMMKSKGFDIVLELAKKFKNEDLHFHFAGNWKNKDDETFFYEFIKKNTLSSSITYHGFVDGNKKKLLFSESHILAYPSREDAFPLTILESLSFGLPVIASSVGAIPSIVNEKCGKIAHNINDFQDCFSLFYKDFLNTSSAISCRNEFQKQYSINTFESRFISILKN